MRAVVVYESMFGNTEDLARAVAAGLGETMDVVVHEVSGAPPRISAPADLVVVGAPTHAFSLSRPATRAEAIAKGATSGKRDSGVREWLTALPRTPRRTPLAAFDTRVDRARRLPGSAARKAAKLARDHGFASAGTRSFYVADTTGPLLPEELGRAREWGRELAEGACATGDEGR